MYLRFTQRANADGSVVRYIALAHNRRVDGQVKPDVLMNLGRVDRLDVAGLRRLADSITKHFGDGALGSDAAEAGLAAGAGPVEVVDARPIGAAWLLDGLWKRLEIDRSLREVLGRRRFGTDVERVLFALVANRAIEPMSKLSAAEWAGQDVVIPGLSGMDDDQAYRAMDLLVEADTQGKVQEAVFFAVANLLNLEVDLLFFDTTSTYFERDEPDEPGDDGFRRYGKSKDHRDDLPQIVIGLAVTRDGIPIRVWCWPGNTTDATVLAEVRDDLRDWKLGRVITVVDRGFSSADNLAYLRRAGGHYIAGMRMRDGNPLAAQALARQGRYQQVRDNLRVKEVRLDATDARFVICHNPDQATRDQAQRDQAVTRIEAELERIATQRSRDRAKTSRTARDRAEAAHVKAECELRDHPTLGRWIRQLKSGRLVIDRAKVTAERRLDGKYLLATSDPHISAEDAALGYKNLLEAERGFRDMKTTLLLRPVFHRLERRIRSHVLICWLALLLTRVAERQSGQTWRRIERETSRLAQVTLAGEAGTVTQTTPLKPAQMAIYQALSIQPPPRVSAFDPT